jgi:ABC-2 type transport system ATP-binding protein
MLESPAPPENPRPIVEIEGLRKQFGDFVAVDSLTLSVAPGEIVALLGPNGAGKTTAIKMLMGLLKSSGGSARIMGHDCFSERAETKRHVGYLPDEPVFYDYLRGQELLIFAGEMHGLSREESRRRVEPWIERLDLGDALEEFAANYSKGMKKKLALIMALLHAPPLLILDEPTTGLDPFAIRTLNAIIREQAEGGRAVFFSTHLLDHAEKLCSRVAIVHKGRLAAVGPLDALRSKLTQGGSLEDIFFQVVGADAEAAENKPEVMADGNAS